MCGPYTVRVHQNFRCYDIDLHFLQQVWCSGVLCNTWFFIMSTSCRHIQGSSKSGRSSRSGRSCRVYKDKNSGSDDSYSSYSESESEGEDSAGRASSQSPNSKSSRRHAKDSIDDSGSSNISCSVTHSSRNIGHPNLSTFDRQLSMDGSGLMSSTSSRPNSAVSGLFSSRHPKETGTLTNTPSQAMTARDEYSSTTYNEHLVLDTSASAASAAVGEEWLHHGHLLPLSPTTAIRTASSTMMRMQVVVDDKTAQKLESHIPVPVSLASRRASVGLVVTGSHGVDPHNSSGDGAHSSHNRLTQSLDASMAAAMSGQEVGHRLLSSDFPPDIIDSVEKLMDAQCLRNGPHFSKQTVHSLIHAASLHPEVHALPQPLSKK